ncbi:TRASH domain-containing protein [Sulfolobus metallicus DSM 6482 = JCM 9184]|uniref:TRASH domain-containing protein n=1 Tax=Sulfuracidifex metallicus DSM 6482 = JCM 9184 TaxID=523847 RepID=A0A6A9QJA1_SULME|nr:TRASH domain-containing protein [Sulfuracidifex metallicus DSM 6482 = JCM 9184]
MPLKIEYDTTSIKCDWCKQVIKGKPLTVKTCCNNKPWVFCSERCYRQWMTEWLRRQEQIKGKRKTGKLL